MEKRKYITAFPGKRDGFHLVIGLYKSRRLQKFVTGIYGLKELLFVKQLRARRNDTIPDSLVSTSFFAEILLRVGIKLGFPAAKAFVLFDRYFSRQASWMAKRTKSSLFLYEFYAE